MSKVRPILLALTALAALSFADPANANLITNPGFETGDFTGWSTSRNQIATASVTGMFNGISPHSGGFQRAEGWGYYHPNHLDDAGRKLHH
jgi:hypothetical protein